MQTQTQTQTQTNSQPNVKRSTEEILQLNSMWFDAANLVRKIAAAEGTPESEILNSLETLIEILNRKTKIQ